MGGNQGGFVPGLYENPNYTPPKNDGSPNKKNDSPATKPATAPERTPAARGEPTLNPAPSTNPAVNQPAVNTPKPWTNPFFAPSASGGATQIDPLESKGVNNPGKLNTGDTTGNTKWNPETRKYEQVKPDATNPIKVPSPSGTQTVGNPAAATPLNPGFKPSQNIPLPTPTPGAAKIPNGAIPEPITIPKPSETPGTCRYKPDETEKIEVKKFKGCLLNSKGNKDYFETVRISVPIAAAAAWKMSLDNQADLLALQCMTSTGGSGVAIPEAWAVRVGTDRPQLVIVYAEVFASGKLGDSRWSLTVPHYNRGEKAPISAPSYRRGSWVGRLALNDGSSLNINAASSADCKRAINKLKILVPNNFRINAQGRASKPRISENPDLGFKSINVVPVMAKFFATGQKTLTPTWQKSLRKST
jgi:hypothetical protein